MLKKIFISCLFLIFTVGILFTNISSAESGEEAKVEITKDNADSSITLKVGQTCKVETSEEIKGYEIDGETVKINEELNQITALKEGTASGYIYINDDKITLYVEVEEKKENEIYGMMTLKITKNEEIIQTQVSNKKEETNQTENNNKQEENSNSTAEIEKLPQTGKAKNEILIILYLIVGISCIGLINIVLSNRKNK